MRRAAFLLTIMLWTTMPSVAATESVDPTNFNVDFFYSLSASYNRNPETDLLYTEKNAPLWDMVGRVLVTGNPTSSTAFDLNILQSIRNLPSLRTPPSSATGVNRSAFLSWSQHDSANSQARMEIDSLHLQWHIKRTDIAVGRQPVNLATTFYFTPNDFFAPFAAQTFYRVYKPGVDAARADIRLDELSQFSLISVLSYSPDPDQDNGWSREPDWGATSALLRYIKNQYDFEWGILGGTVDDYGVYGGSLQGEAFDWLGIRAAGHYGVGETDETNDYYKVAVGIEHRFPSSLDLRLEYFHNNSGYHSIIEAAAAQPAGNTDATYFGRDYTALGLSYEINPLLNASALAMVNWTDHSQLYSLYCTYSVSDEADLALTVAVPNGREPEQMQINSEFGSAPWSIAIEFRQYQQGWTRLADFF